MNKIAIAGNVFLLVAITACTDLGPVQPNENYLQPVAQPGIGIIPANLSNIESRAEDIVDTAQESNWSQIDSDIADIDNSWVSYQPRASLDGVPQNLQNAVYNQILQLKMNAAAKNSLTTMQAANQLNLLVMNISDIYHPIVPTDIGRLDVYEYQIIIDVNNINYLAARQSLARVNTTWDRVKPSIMMHGGAIVASKFEHSLVMQSNALNMQNPQEIVSQAKIGLELVDEMEKLY